MSGYFPQSQRAKEPMAVVLGIAKKVERDPCQRCGQNPEHGTCKHGTCRNLSVRS